MLPLSIPRVWLSHHVIQQLHDIALRDVARFHGADAGQDMPPQHSLVIAQRAVRADELADPMSAGKAFV